MTAGGPNGEGGSLLTSGSRTGTFAQLTGTDLGGGLSYSAVYAAGDVKVHVGPAVRAAATPSESSPASDAPPTTVDDRAFRITSGRWTRRPFDGDRGGTFTATRSRGATLVSPRLRGRRLELVAHTCPTCGAVEVVWGGRRLGTVSLRSRRTRRTVLPVATPAKPRAGTVRLRAASSRRVAIDALKVF